MSEKGKEGGYMYSEKYEQRGFSCKPFLLRIILLIVLVFFIIDILPNLVKTNIITNSKNKFGKIK